MAPPDDPLGPLVGLPGVAAAVARARDALVRVHNHPVNRRGWPATAAEAGLRAARASAALDGAVLHRIARGPARPDGTGREATAPDEAIRDPTGPDEAISDGTGRDRRDDAVTDPVLAGAVRVAEESGRLLAVWRTAPLQALARLHVLAAADLVPDPELGRPRGDAATSARLALLADLVTGGTAVPAPVLVAVVHGELLGLAPFGSADGVVARAAARLTALSSGLDPKGLAVPEVGHLRRAAEYRAAAAGFAAGTAEGMGSWLRHCCAQWEAGAREGRSIADARSTRS